MSNGLAKMPLATRRRALELGATFIENDLAEMRADAIRNDELGRNVCIERDFMKVAEWASAAVLLRAMADLESRAL